MRRLFLAVLVCAMAGVAVAQEVATRGPSSTKSAFSRLALMPGAVYEVRIQVPSSRAEEYLYKYASWFLPVDQTEGSGRKLVSVLSSEIGGEYNLVFLFWYESPYKENYYCKYSKAFFEHHKGNAAFRKKYQETRTALGRTDPDLRYADVESRLAACANNQPPIEVAETIGKFDQELSELIVSQRDSWNVAVNPCFVMKLREQRDAVLVGKGKTIEEVEKEMKGKDKGGEDICERSLLERAISPK